jgi:hypothetical protein
MSLPLISQPSKNTAIGVFENNGKSDIFQIVGPDGALQVHMNHDGSIDPPIYPQIISAHVTSAQLLALNTTFVPIIPAPGPGLRILPQQFSVIYNFGGTPYTVTGGDNNFFAIWQGQTDSMNTALGAVPDVGFLDQAVSQIFITAAGAIVATPLVQSNNKAVGLLSNDIYTLGNGTLDITMSYVISAV